MEDIKNKLENYKEELSRQKAARLNKGDTTKGKHIRKLEAKVKLYEGFLNLKNNTMTETKEPKRLLAINRECDKYNRFYNIVGWTQLQIQTKKESFSQDKWVVIVRYD